MEKSSAFSPISSNDDLRALAVAARRKAAAPRRLERARVHRFRVALVRHADRHGGAPRRGRSSVRMAGERRGERNLDAGRAQRLEDGDAQLRLRRSDG